MSDTAPYWLCRALAECVEKMPCDRELQGCSGCTQADDCVTEYCAPCAARAWMADGAKSEKQDEAKQAAGLADAIRQIKQEIFRLHKRFAIPVSTQLSLDNARELLFNAAVSAEFAEQNKD